MKFNRFELAGRFRMLNRSTQLILLTMACVLGGYLAHRWLPVCDISSNGRHSLTPETVAYVEGLPSSVEIVASLSLGEKGSMGAARTRALTELLGRYARLGDKITLRWVDGYRAQREFSFSDPYRIMVRSGQAVEWVLPEDLWQRDAGSEKFMGEKIITSAIAKVSGSSGRKILLYTDSDKLSDVSSLGLSDALGWLKDNTSQVEVVSQLPNEISGYQIVCLWGNADSLNSDNLAVLQRAINREGVGLWVALDGHPSQALERFLYYNAVEVSPEYVQFVDQTPRTPSGDLILEGWGNAAFVQNFSSQHQRLLSNGLWVGLAPRSDGLDSEISSILQLDSPQNSIALAVRRSSAATSLPARLIVFGGMDWLENAAIQFPGNLALAQSCFDWLSHAAILSSIPPRQTQLRQLSISNQQLWKIGLSFGGCVCVLLLMAGVCFLTRPR